MTTDFQGLPVRSLENGHLRVDYLAEAFTAICADILLTAEADIHAIVDKHLSYTAQRLNSTLAYY